MASHKSVTGYNYPPHEEVAGPVAGLSESDRHLYEAFRGKADSQESVEAIEGYTRDLRHFLSLKFPYDRSEVDDVIAQTWLQVASSINTFEGRGKLSAWIRTIAVHKMLNVKRKRHSSLYRTNGEDSLSDYPDVHAKQPVEEIQNGEEHLHLWAQVQALRPLDREMLMLHYVDGVSSKDIGLVLKIPKGTVKSRLNTACRHLRERMRRVVS